MGSGAALAPVNGSTPSSTVRNPEPRVSPPLDLYRSSRSSGERRPSRRSRPGRPGGHGRRPGDNRASRARSSPYEETCHRPRSRGLGREPSGAVGPGGGHGRGSAQPAVPYPAGAPSRHRCRRPRRVADRHGHRPVLAEAGKSSATPQHRGPSGPLRRSRPTSAITGHGRASPSKVAQKPTGSVTAPIGTSMPSRSCPMEQRTIP